MVRRIIGLLRAARKRSDGMHGALLATFVARAGVPVKIRVSISRISGRLLMDGSPACSPGRARHRLSHGHANAIVAHLTGQS
jgi:hypothetical protein